MNMQGPPPDDAPLLDWHRYGQAVVAALPENEESARPIDALCARHEPRKRRPINRGRK